MPNVKILRMICRGRPPCRPMDFGPTGAKIHNFRIRRTCQETRYPVLRNGTSGRSLRVYLLSLRHWSMNPPQRAIDPALQLLPSWKKATALAAATFKESTPWVMGILTV